MGIFMVPAIRSFRVTMREQGRNVSCMQNLSRLGAGLSSYAADNDDRLPVADRWMDELQTAGTRDRNLHCPEVRSVNPGAFGYAFNKEMSGKKVSEVKPNTVALFDSTFLTRNATSGIESLPNPGRHKGRGKTSNNLIMLDGSMEVRYR